MLISRALAGPHDISALQYSANGKFVAAGSNDGSIVLCERESGRELWKLAGEGRQILGLQFRKADKQVLSFETEWPYRLRRCCRRARSQKTVAGLFRKQGDEPAGLTLADLDEPDDILAVSNGFALYLLDVERALNGPDKLVLISWDRQAEPKSLAVRDCLFAPITGREVFTDLRFSNRQRTVIALNDANLLFVWQWDDAQSSGQKEKIEPSIRNFGRTFGSNTGLAIGAKGQFVTVGYTKKFGGVQLWDLAKAEMIYHTPDYPHPSGNFNRAVFNHAGDVVITSDEIVDCVWENQDSKLRLLGQIFHRGFADHSAISFSPDDNEVAVPDYNEVAVGIEPTVALIEPKRIKLVRYLGQPPRDGIDSDFEERVRRP